MLQGHSDGEGMSLVLASLSSAFYTCDSKILWYKEKKMSCESCVFSSEGPFGPPPPPFLVLEWHCKRSMGDFSTLCCNLYFLDDAVFQCGGGFFSRPLHLRLFVFPNMAPLPFCARACRWMCVDVKKKKKNQKKKKRNRCRGQFMKCLGNQGGLTQASSTWKQSGRDDPFLSAELPNESQRSWKTLPWAPKAVSGFDYSEYTKHWKVFMPQLPQVF